MERRLAAILAADMVGYSRLMAADEAGTLARLTALRGTLIDPKIAEYGGHLVKSTGDGVLVEFPSVVDALRCAVTVQLAMAEHQAAEAVETRIAYRIGINLGDIILEDGDIYGDGVNVAARMETLADPGGISVSRTVVDHVKGKVTSGFEDQGQKEVKNIPEPVHVFRVLMKPEAVGQSTTRAKPKAWWQRPAAAAAAVLVLAARCRPKNLGARRLSTVALARRRALGRPPRGDRHRRPHRRLQDASRPAKAIPRPGQASRKNRSRRRPRRRLQRFACPVQ